MLHRRHFLLLSAAVPLAACAPTPRTNPLSRSLASNLQLGSINVSTAGAAYENARAGEYATRLGPDLEAALRQELSGRLSPGAPARMEVEVSRLNLASSARTAFGSDQSALVGSVRLVSPDQGVLASYVVDARAGEAAETRAGALLDTALNLGDRYYRRLLTTFADDTEQQISA
ncbi:hypothetical protein [Tranquillimonas alkanivorans]|uniref:Uncharacterized protein n=1 Tax=Tranquillimonas alkanivorans TaxID=441119 RepID=A0A1I5TZH1_9RHOB|nr:hypothetical protein [Tranquillimonas alkanivorans]SFP88470.1 hypothetical protein SAMN04488047_11638 [Tranquillimonas alkanivorans]